MDNVAHSRRTRRSRPTGHRAPLAGAVRTAGGAGLGAGMPTRRRRGRDHHDAVSVRGRRPGVRRAPHGQRRGRGGQPMDPGRGALRLVLLPARRAPSSTPSPNSARTARSTACSPSRSPPTTTTRSGRSRSGPGITFTDGTPLNAAAVVYNLQAAGTSILVSAALRDIATRPRPRPPRPACKLKIEQTDDMTFVIYTGKNGDPDQPMPWRNFDAQLTAQWGMIASPFWLGRRRAEPRARHPAGRHRPVHRRQLLAPRVARGEPQPRLLDDGRRRATNCRTSTRSRSASSRTPRPPPRRCSPATST